jgi:ParB family transcriptional regulator, chromosome partitioning protein
VWKDLPEWSRMRNAENIRAAITEAHMNADSKLARFVTVAAYEAAGGVVLRDLFDAEGAGWITDPALLKRLASEKLEREAERLRTEEGWKWVEIRSEIDWDTLRHSDRIFPTPTKQQQAALDELQAERDKIEDEDSKHAAQIFAELDKLESEIAFTAEEKASCRVIVTISDQADFYILPGLVWPENRSAVRNLKVEATNGDADKPPPC